ncbi:unnamed protein product [Rhodiola kirilowii]
MATDSKVYALEEVSSHNSLKDCWLVIFGKASECCELLYGNLKILLGMMGLVYGKSPEENAFYLQSEMKGVGKEKHHSNVYDVTEFMDDHPGGGDVLLTSTGKDATEDFEDVGHSKAAREQLEKYYIGEIDASTLSKKKKYTAPQSNQSSQASSGGDYMIKILQFLVPLMILALALVVRHYTRNQEPSS